MSTFWPDENEAIAPHLDDKKFVESREIILTLLPKLFPDGSSKFSSLELIELFIDEAVADIANIWTDKTT